VIHRTYRRLDEGVRFAGLGVGQWCGLVLGGGAVVGAVWLLGVPVKPAITLCALVIGVPAVLAYVSEGTGISPLAMVRDLWRWRTRPGRLPAGGGGRAGVFVEPDLAAVHELEELTP
jgi:hypothetical protein